MSYFSLAKRDNNPLRDFLIVNKFQSKHFPGSPSLTVKSFKKLGKAVKALVKTPDGEGCLVVGFAETAVAVGAFIARELGEKCLFISTTREELPEYFGAVSFEERHSHAQKHSLCLAKKERFKSLRAVIIADDEFTTGNTALSLINELKKLIPEGCLLFAAGFLMSDESRALFSENGVKCVCENDFGVIEKSDFPKEFLPDEKISPRNFDAEIRENAIFDFRLGVFAGEFFAECERLCEDILSKIGEISGNIRVIGTEENCLLPVLLGEKLEKQGKNVLVHGVTRSPMLPARGENYPIKSRARLESLYESGRAVYLYNCEKCDAAIILTDAENPSENAVKALCGAIPAEKIFFVRQKNKPLPTSFKGFDAILLLKDISGQLAPLDAKERGRLIDSGVHYSELLPAEYEPSAEYLRQYEAGLSRFAKETANAVISVAERIFESKGENAVIVSLARAGTPIGALITRYIRKKHGVIRPHYSISIIRGKGVDENAMKYILARHSPENIQFVDGWTGKGAINSQLREALAAFPAVSDELAVLADPAGVCEICGTREDIFIPCSCLNSVVSGLFSRTVQKSDITGENDFHGAAYFEALAANDRTYEFIEAVEREMDLSAAISFPLPQKEKNGGLSEAREIAAKFGVNDINLIKPSIGEATRVLLRRVPRLILVREKGSVFTSHIEELAREKGVPVEEYPLKFYRAVGIIKSAEI